MAFLLFLLFSRFSSPTPRPHGNVILSLHPPPSNLGKTLLNFRASFSSPARNSSNKNKTKKTKKHALFFFCQKKRDCDDNDDSSPPCMPPFLPFPFMFSLSLRAEGGGGNRGRGHEMRVTERASESEKTKSFERVGKRAREREEVSLPAVCAPFSPSGIFRGSEINSGSAARFHSFLVLEKLLK